MTNEIKKIVSSLALASALLPQQMQSADVKGNIDVLAGGKATTTDAKLNVTVSPKLNILVRSRIENPYDKESIPFTLLNSSYELTPHVRPFMEGQFTQKRGAVPRAGVIYKFDAGNFHFLNRLVVDTQENPTFDVHPIISYSRKLNNKFNFVGGLEAIPSFSFSGEPKSILEMGRIGLEYKRVSFGFGIDLKQSGKNLQNQPINKGVYLNWRF